jgi:hypothetical protein
MGIDFENDAQALTVKDDGISDIAGLAKLALQLEREIVELDETIKERKEALRTLTETRIPEALTELGMSSFRMADGSSIEVKPFYSASIPAERKGEAYEWLRQHGYDDIIKNTVSVQFGRGEDDDAGKMIDLVRQSGWIPDQAEKIESMTLKAWVREMVEQGVEFPSELFGAHVGLKAKIKSA